MQLLCRNREIVWISPRSFCNDPYFLPFPKHLLANMALREVPIFESRDTAFGQGEVLQENVIVSATKSRETPDRLTGSRVGAPDRCWQHLL
jgi:adenine-specific DNA-methyltransferase